MSEPITASEARQILDVLKEVQGDMKSVKSDVQSLTVEVKVMQAELKGLRDDLNELRTQQRSTDGRLWVFVAGLVTLLGGSLLTGLARLLWVRQLI
ncbi:hypothetical protein RIF25_04650 [Thermosynechococcaceae cyanobacterium BACA0444]|uniref:Uncharacterized protein n=1 Tax=Pseudocalidococcus azoricus BACA0444 TaxID=2918990 RepID=A0AAE4FQZ7_9CYAN|nr:hypothetical protein [Pseudocalidococcus azoricus]MDS3860093.1 hypothetical protein [Pseudocalidococcus azoricus BACA0444]